MTNRVALYDSFARVAELPAAQDFDKFSRHRGLW